MLELLGCRWLALQTVDQRLHSNYQQSSYVHGLVNAFGPGFGSVVVNVELQVLSESGYPLEQEEEYHYGQDHQPIRHGVQHTR